MNWRKIAAMILTVFLLLALCVPFATAQTSENEEGQIEEPTGKNQGTKAEIMPADEGAPSVVSDASDGAMLTPEAAVVEILPSPAPAKPKFYIVLYDCGHALYGTEFSDSRVPESGDPNGELLQFAAQAVTVQAKENSYVCFLGYNSKLFSSKDGKTLATDLQLIPATNGDAVQKQIEQLLNAPARQRMSSQLATALRELSKMKGFETEINNYDCTLIVISGGVENPMNSEPKLDEIRSYADELRNMGVVLRIYGLEPQMSDENSKDCLLKNYFADYGEYHGFPVDGVAFEDAAPIIMDVPADSAVQLVATDQSLTDAADSYASARFEMMRAIAAGFMAGKGEFVEKDGDEVIAMLDKEAAAECPVILRLADGTVKLMKGREAYEAYSREYAEANQNSTLSPKAYLWQELGVGFGSDLRLEISAENEDEELLRNEMVALRNKIKEQTAAGLDVRDEKVEFDLPKSYDGTLVEIVSSDPNLLEIKTEGGKLILIPKVTGIVDINGGRIGTEFSQENAIPVRIRDTRMDWSWQEDESSVELTDGANVQAQAGNPLDVTIYAGVLCWKIERVAVGAQTEEVIEQEVEGNSIDDPNGGTLPGLSWSVTSDESGTRLTFLPSGIGSFKITCWTQSETEEVIDAEAKSIDDGMAIEAAASSGDTTEAIMPTREESRELNLHRQLDAAEEIELIAPYFKHQNKQTISLTSGGKTAQLANYDVALIPKDVAAVYMDTEAGTLFIEPFKSGEAAITITERDVKDPRTLTVNLRVKPLFANAWLWLCIAGIVVCLVGLTSAIVIVIGKSGRRSAEGRD